MTASWTCYGGMDNATVLFGTKGVMRISGEPNSPVTVTFPDGTTKAWQAESDPENSGVIDLWMSCLANGRKPEISGESALSAMRAVFAAVESSRTGRTVEIPENR